MNKFLKNLLFQIGLSIIFAAISAYLYFIFKNFDINLLTVIGISLIALSFFWLYLYIFITLIKQIIHIWLIFPFIVIFSIGIPFLMEDLNFLNFVLFVGLSIGICLLIAGIYWKLFGLVIPGALLLGIPPGLYFAWERTSSTNPLEQTGIMLVGFAFGWGLITVSSRALTKNFIWWPLIPGGILAVVGWGLFIAGNPESAVSFIGNTGSVGLIIFGIYLLLMRRSFHQ